jgi:hypothetical protein
MPTDPLANAVETFAAPIDHLIIALGQGIAQAQQALDQNSIQTQETIDTNPALSQYGLQATWYQFPSVSMLLKMSLSIAQDQPGNAPVNAALSTLPVGLRLVAQPTSASFQTHFNYDATAATELNLTIVPVPPPNPRNQVSTPPKMTTVAVQAAALASAAPFVTTKDGQGNKVPATVDASNNALNLIINFNASARIWYVLQYAPSNATVRPVVVAVDDETGSVRIIG